MSWNDPPSAEASAASMRSAAMASILLAVVALCVPPAAVMLDFFRGMRAVPLLLLLSVGIAWKCWWKCLQDAAVGGFGWTLAALFVSHTVMLLCWMAFAAMVDGGRGVTWAIAIALVYFAICAVLSRSTALKYAIGAMCLFVVGSSLLLCAIHTARIASQMNSVRNHLRQFGMGHEGSYDNEHRNR